MPKEIVRRVILVAGLAAVAWLLRLTPSVPFLSIQLVDFARSQQDSRRPTPDGRAECQLSLDEFIAYRTGGRIVAVSGSEWRGFFDRAQAALEWNTVPSGWERRVTADELKASRLSARRGEKDSRDFTRLFFWAAEPPFAAVSGRFSTEEDYYLKLDSTPPRYLELFYRPRLRASGLNSGFYGIPRAFCYPLLGWTPWLAALTFMIYVLIPWPQRGADTAIVARWRIMGSDAASALLLFFMFFAMPLFIVGSSRQAATEYFFFTAVFWLFSLFGLLILYWGAIWSAFHVTVLPDRLRIGHLWGEADLAFGDLAEVQAATIKAPGWLVRALKILSLMGGRRGMMAAGQAALMASSEAKGYLLLSKDGRKTYLWYTDQLGHTAMDGFGKVEAALRGSGAPVRTAPVQLRGVFPPFH